MPRAQGGIPVSERRTPAPERKRRKSVKEIAATFNGSSPVVVNHDDFLRKQKHDELLYRQNSELDRLRLQRPDWFGGPYEDFLKKLEEGRHEDRLRLLKLWALDRMQTGKEVSEETAVDFLTFMGVDAASESYTGAATPATPAATATPSGVLRGSPSDPGSIDVRHEATPSVTHRTPTPAAAALKEDWSKAIREVVASVDEGVVDLGGSELGSELDSELGSELGFGSEVGSPLPLSPSWLSPRKRYSSAESLQDIPETPPSSPEPDAEEEEVGLIKGAKWTITRAQATLHAVQQSLGLGPASPVRRGAGAEQQRRNVGVALSVSALLALVVCVVVATLHAPALQEPAAPMDPAPMGPVPMGPAPISRSYEGYRVAGVSVQTVGDSIAPAWKLRKVDEGRRMKPLFVSMLEMDGCAAPLAPRPRGPGMFSQNWWKVKRFALAQHRAFKQAKKTGDAAACAPELVV